MLRTLKISLGHWLRAPPARRTNPPHAATRRRRSRLGPGLTLASLAIVAALAYRSLVFWDPGGPGLPSIGWFVFGISDTAPQLVLAIVIGLVFQRRERILRAIGEPRSPLLGVGALLASGVLFFWGRHADAPEFLALSLAFLLLGSALYVLGRGVARELGPPLLILLFAMPIPGIVLNHVLFPLQVAAAAQLAWLLDVVGITAVREGIVLQLMDHSIHVIESCSGLRGIIVLTMLAACWATFFSMRPLAALVLIASAPLIALAVNAARVLSVSLNPYADLAAAHTFQGAAIFMAGIVLLCGVDALLRHTLGHSTRPEAIDPDASGTLPHHWQRRAILPALVVLVLLVASIRVPVWQLESRARPSMELPASLGGWHLDDEKLRVDGLFLGRAVVRNHVYRRYAQDRDLVSVYVAHDDRRDRSLSVLSPKTGLPGPGWAVEERDVRSLGPERLDARWLVARSHARRVAVLHWYEGVEELGTEMARAWLAMDRSALRRPCGSLAVRLETEQVGGVDGQRRAEARLLEMAGALRPYLAGVACPGSDEGPEISSGDSSRIPSIPNWKKGAEAAG